MNLSKFLKNNLCNFQGIYHKNRNKYHKINYVEYFTTYVWNTYCCRSDIKMLEIMSFTEKDETR